MDFGATLQNKLGEHDPKEIEELILDNLFQQEDCLTKNQKDTLEEYKSLIHLSMNGIGIKYLKNMPKIESLQILELNDNKIAGGDLNELVSLYPNLYKLKVVNNQISSIDIFKCLQKSNIKKIYLKKNPCSENKNYITEVFKLIPELTCVDSMSKEGEQVDSTIYDEEDEENDVCEDDEEFDEDDDKDDEEFNEESEEDEDEDDDDDEEDGNPKPKKKH